jgi:hypothetical protein
MTKLTQADAVCSLVVHNRTINYRLSVQVLSTAPLFTTAWGQQPRQHWRMRST